MSTTIQIADKPTLDSVSTKVGDTNDTGGSSTAGTIMGKLNKLISGVSSGSGRQFGSAIEWGSLTVSRDEETVINGKRVVFLYGSVGANNNEQKVSVKVDGVSICTNKTVRSIVETIEFNQSFSIIYETSQPFGSSMICEYILY